jgi:hypothetical protein
MRASAFHSQYLLSLALVLFFMSGCKREGCTDPAALNYNSVANEDDGSCLFCEDGYTENKFELDVIDDNFSSVFFNQVVAKVNITHVVEGYQFEQCGDSQCKVYYEVQNMTNMGITFYYNLFLSGISTPSDFANLQAYQTSARDSIVFSGSDLCSVTADFSWVNLNSTISYF